MANPRIRIVLDNGVAIALVRAPNEAQALRYSLRKRFTAPIATQDQLIEFGNVLKVEDSAIDPNPIDPSGAA